LHSREIRFSKSFWRIPTAERVRVYAYQFSKFLGLYENEVEKACKNEKKVKKTKVDDEFL